MGQRPALGMIARVGMRVLPGRRLRTADLDLRDRACRAGGDRPAVRGGAPKNRKGAQLDRGAPFHSRTAKACRFKAGVAGYRYGQWTIDDAAVREFQEAVERCRRKAKACAARPRSRPRSLCGHHARRPSAGACSQSAAALSRVRADEPDRSPCAETSVGSRPAFFALAFTIKLTDCGVSVRRETLPH